jgi:hypothetical protein
MEVCSPQTVNFFVVDTELDYMQFTCINFHLLLSPFYVTKFHSSTVQPFTYLCVDMRRGVGAPKRFPAPQS